jgi:hypothetical protein
MTTNDAPADTGDVDALAFAMFRRKYGRDPVPESFDGGRLARCREDLAYIKPELAARDAAQRADGALEVLRAVEALIGPDVVFPEWEKYPHMFRITQRRPDLGAEVTTTVVDERALRKAVARAGTAGGSDA